MNSREVSKNNGLFWVSAAYRRGGHMTQKRRVVPDNEPRSYRKGNSHRNDWRENYMTIEMKMDQKYEQGREIAEIAEDLDQSEEYVKSLICSQE